MMNKELRKALNKVKKNGGTFSSKFTVYRDGYYFTSEKVIEGQKVHVDYRYYRPVKIVEQYHYPYQEYGSIELPVALLEIGEIESVEIHPENNESQNATDHGIDTVLATIRFDNTIKLSWIAEITHHGETVSNHGCLRKTTEVQELRHCAPYNGIVIDANEVPQ